MRSSDSDPMTDSAVKVSPICIPPLAPCARCGFSRDIQFLDDSISLTAPWADFPLCGCEDCGGCKRAPSGLGWLYVWFFQKQTARRWGRPFWFLCVCGSEDEVIRRIRQADADIGKSDAIQHDGVTTARVDHRKPAHIDQMVVYKVSEIGD